MNINTAMILAGGLGTRFKEYTKDIPKPMIKANGLPLIMHIINHYKRYEVKNFLILAGYKQEIIYDYFKENFKKFKTKNNTFSIQNNVHVKILDTGEKTMTGGRIKQGLELLNDEICYLTYGDGIANVDLNELSKFHYKFNPLVTLTAVRPPARFGSLIIENERVVSFNEKKQSNEGWINGGYFIINQKVKEYIKNDSVSFEKEPLTAISKNQKLNAYMHSGLFRPVDTIRELEILQEELTNNDFGFKK